jgi:hypothetical protein
MFKNSMTPTNVTGPAPARPGIIYTQRATEYARIMATAKTVTR